MLKLVLFLPLLGFIIAGLISRIPFFSSECNINNSLCKKDNKNNDSPQIKKLKKSDRISQIVTTSLMAIVAITSIKLFYDFSIDRQVIIEPIMTWINSGNFNANWEIRFDSLVAIMLVVVSFVSFLVHLYSVSYMSEDKSIARFMAYLSLFTFFMLMLVTANNFLQLFFGWEGVGLASYLLIGFWFQKETANNAAMKAFITNRIGDLGLIIAIALIYLSFNSINFTEIFIQIASKNANYFNVTQNIGIFFGYPINTIDIIAIALFIGAMGKSAQIILHIWLADAMEGPTPVSALIHAATMVTAGVFLVARCSPIFELSELALNFITIIGAITAIFAATIAITQNDIKKIIAYSTCSQLGYMFFACGISIYQAAIFHLATHAFFKALLFLAAGSVIHSLHHEQDIRKMGGLAKKIPLTCAAIWIGSIALAGFPPLSGFFSKDLIIEAAYQSHSKFGKIAYFLGLIAACLTSFYSWRLIFIVFYGKNRGDEKYYKNAHEGSISMKIPLIILIIGSLFAGIIGAKLLNFTSVENNFFSDSIIVGNEKLQLLEESHHAPLIVKLSAIIVSILAIIIAYIFYIKKPNIPKIIAKRFAIFYKISLNKYYFDEIYQFLIINPIKRIGSFMWKIIDSKIIDSPSKIFILLVQRLSNLASRISTGYVYNHILTMVITIIAIGAFLYWFAFINIFS